MGTIGALIGLTKVQRHIPICTTSPRATLEQTKLTRQTQKTNNTLATIGRWCIATSIYVIDVVIAVIWTGLTTPPAAAAAEAARRIDHEGQEPQKKFAL